MVKSRWTSLKIFKFDEMLYENISNFDNQMKLSSEIQNNNYDCIIGLDEAGRGSGAGAVFAGAVCFFDIKRVSSLLLELNDSKKISETVREKLFPVIEKNSFFSIAKTETDEIERINILNASLLAMKNAAIEVINQAGAKNPLLLIDGNRIIKNFNYAQKTIIKGDSTSASIAAASILAKVSRDNYMLDLDKTYPNYNFKRNKGYLTKEHIAAIQKFGICDIHRKSFLRNIIPAR